MDTAVKTNRLAIVSFVVGLVGLISIGITVLPVLSLPSLGNLPEPASPIYVLMGLFRSVRDLSAIVSPAAGIVALRAIRQKGGQEKGMYLAWAGIILGAGWILFRVAVALIFILALFFPLR